MISAQILQNIITGLKNITKHDLSVTEREGKVIVSTEEEMPGKTIESIRSFVAGPAEGMSLQGYNYFKVFDNNVAEYVIIAKGDDRESYQTGQLAAFQVQNLLVAYKERYDRDNFVKNLLLDNLLLVDIYTRAKKMDIENSVERIVYLVEPENDDFDILEILREVFPVKVKDFVTAVDENSIILVREINDKETKEDIIKVAENIISTLLTEHLIKTRIATGSKVNDLKNVSLSYKEAKMAMEICKIFYPERSIINYEEMGVGRLIYQLPVSLCKIFMNEVLNDTDLEYFDDEILTTVAKFFENNLNVSETSRQLYIHRNTLVYRLDKIQKVTGLDLRNFDDAIIFKIALMVSKYTNYKESLIG